jgi:hypothetical protein
MSDDNKLNDIRNVLGFLLAGFGAVLTFVGVRSSEVSTILRNDSPQASLIALVLLLGILAAVSAITVNSEKKVSVSSVWAMGAILFGVGALVIFLIPVGLSPFNVSGWISLGIGCLLVLYGTLALLAGFPSRWHLVDKDHGVGIVDILILASVLLIAIAAYGAIRLESKSQLSFSSQVGASFSTDGPLTTASVDIAATKIPQADWVFVYVYAIPMGISLMNMCESVAPANNVDHCITDPCGTYFADQANICYVLLNGSIVPNATGDVDETLSVPFTTAKFQDVDVRAFICSANNNERCEASLNGQNSRLDWIISTTRGVPNGA